MSLTLLLDLDDTLLYINTDRFIQAYFKALARHMAEHGVGEGFTDILRRATHQMLVNRRPDVTLQQAFNADFFPKLDAISPPALKFVPGKAGDDQPISQTIMRFYEEVFPTLRSETEFRPKAVKLVKDALQRGYRVVVATNPLFPRTATYQRLEWAGLSPRDFPFEVVTTYEDFHFTKPHPAYYAEILAQMGFPEGPVVMAGNELQDDMEGALQLGIGAFWVKPDGKELIRGEMSVPGLEPHASGDLDQVLAWIDTRKPEDLTPDFSSPSAASAVLRAVPAAIASLLTNVPDDFFQFHPQAGEWGALEILCHLRDVENEIFSPRLQRTLAEDAPVLADISASAWAEARNYHTQHPHTALAEFTAARIKTLQLIQDAPPDDWQRTARHKTYGNLTFAQLVHRMVRHDQAHVRQLKSLLSAFPLEAR